ncbi:inositol monophosphatase family protein [Rubrobacter indicoceani]|uniref:inositol monophosphatase family protein n=1 Tax=Rubrobacter indicoceani TaxID=2051957 RepID=UPI0013C51ADF|nr:inositol monophosphatase [Rubrobacter indicoceani]
MNGQNPSGPDELHDFLCDLARRAGELQMSRYERPGDIREKAPKDIVTEVDFLCEDLIVQAIEARYPDDAILSEERGGEIAASGRSWLVDPIDGTANFARANPLFCSCIAVMEDGEVTNAVVAAPRIGDLYHARRGAGTFRESNGETSPVKVSETQSLEYALVGADMSLSRVSKRNQRYREALDEIFSGCWQFRALGSAGIRGAWLASGYLDVSVGTHNTPWDYAPTVLLVTEAGGRATDLTGEPWSPEAEGLLATSGGPLHEELLGVFRRGTTPG